MMLVTFVTTFPHHWGGDGGHMWDDHMWGGGWMWIWPLLMVAMVVAVGVAVWLATRAGRPADRDGTGRAREVLAERYARGELSTEEYHERLEHLR